MPLQLGGVETERRQVVVWDQDSNEQVRDALNKIIELKNNGFSVLSESDGEVVLEPPKIG